MSQPSITSFFNSRKRAASEDIYAVKNKVQVLDRPETSQLTTRCGGTLKNVKHLSNKKEGLGGGGEPSPARGKRCRAVAKLCFEELGTDSSSRSPSHNTPPPADTLKVVSPKKASPSKMKALENCPPITAFMKKQNAANVAKNVKENAINVSESRKELSLGDLKSKLAGSSRLAELKASAARLSRGFQQLKELEAKRNLKEFKSIDVEVPTSPSKRSRFQDGLQSPQKLVLEPIHEAAPKEKLLMSPRKVVVSPVKSPSKVPAYIKHASLATSTSLPLPHHYRSLAEVFRGLETVASLLYNRKEKITFEKLRPSVQEMLKKNFTGKHLEQIKHIVPEFYTYYVQNIKSFSGTSQKQAYELVVTPVLPPGVTVMNPTLLLERRREFFNRLTREVKQHHSKFLVNLDPPMVIPDEKLARWHPEFELEKVPEVNCSKLPEMPNTETYSTAQEVLARASTLFNCNTRMERALQKLAEAKERGLTEQEQKVTGLSNGRSTETKSVESQTTTVPSASNITILNPALRNLPASLLEKVRAKQAAKALEAMTRTTEDEKKCLVYSRLPDLARTLRNIFVTERKNVLALNVVLSKLDNSFQAKVSAPDLRDDIKILTEIFPGWVSLQSVRNVTYLKLDRATSLEKVKEKLQGLADKYKNM